jgi:hypothetical protein
VEQLPTRAADSYLLLDPERGRCRRRPWERRGQMPPDGDSQSFSNGRVDVDLCEKIEHSVDANAAAAGGELPAAADYRESEMAARSYSPAITWWTILSASSTC